MVLPIGVESRRPDLASIRRAGQSPVRPPDPI
uniref:Uncharacterized protein n=1 Tax=Arundo donax TaxID=35708 RepID=A0A0A9CFM4_ARUDO